MPSVAELNIEITAATEKLRTELRRGEVAVEKFEKSVTQRLDKMAALFKAGLFAYMAVNALGRLTHAAVAASDAIGILGEKSENLGVSTDFYQTIVAGSIDAGIQVEKLDAAMAKFAKNISEARQGTGSLVTALEDVNPALLDALRGARNNEEAFRILADASQKATSSTQRVTIALAAFGAKAGLPMQQILKGGSAGLDEMAARAEVAGAKLDGSIIRRADDLGDRFSYASKVLDTQFKRALVEIMPFLTRGAELLGWMAKAANDFGDQIRDIENASTSGLETRLENLRAQLDKSVQGMEYLRQNPGLLFNEMGLKTYAKNIAALQEQIAQIEETIRSREAQSTYERTRNRASEDDLRDIEALKTKREAALRELETLQKNALASSGNLRAVVSKEYEIDLQKYKGLLEKKLISEEEYNKAVQNLRVISGEKMRDVDEKQAQADRDLRALHTKALGNIAEQQQQAQAEYDADLVRFRKMLHDKLISQQQFDAAVLDMGKVRAQKLQELDVNFQMATQAANAFGREIESALSEAFDSGEFNAKKMFATLYKEIAMTALRLYALQPLFGGGNTQNGGMFGQFLSGLTSPAPSAMGNVFSRGDMVPFADGGIVSKPTIFGMKSGRLGIMGEAGEEAIMPLVRTSDGKLGVNATGGGAAQHITVNIQARDVESFRASRSQIGAQIARMAAAGRRNS